jgi:hypothetical protein
MAGSERRRELRRRRHRRKKAKKARVREIIKNKGKKKEGEPAG